MLVDSCLLVCSFLNTTLCNTSSNAPKIVLYLTFFDVVLFIVAFCYIVLHIKSQFPFCMLFGIYRSVLNVAKTFSVNCQLKEINAVKQLLLCYCNFCGKYDV